MYIDLQKLAKHVTTLGSDSLFYTSFPNRKKNRIGETPDRDLPKLAPIHNGSLSKSHKMEEKSASSVINTETKNYENEMQQAIHTKSTEQGTIHILRKHF
jgi:hypothetical protein